MQRTTTQVTIGIVFVIGGILWTYLDPSRNWALWGAFTGLVSIALLLLNEAIFAHGYSYQEIEDVAARETAGRETKWARDNAAWFKVVGLPLMILAAWFQLRVPDPVLLDPITGARIETNGTVKREIVGTKQVLFNVGVKDKIERLEGAYAALFHPDLLVKNCATQKECDCIEPYKKVPQEPDGAWNLNGGVSGKSDSIVLCIAWRSVPALPTLPEPTIPTAKETKPVR